MTTLRGSRMQILPPNSGTGKLTSKSFQINSDRRKIDQIVKRDKIVSLNVEMPPSGTM
jgi:hypothetical protein